MVTGYWNKNGSWADSSDYRGYSVFAEGKIDAHWRIIGRYEIFDLEVDVDKNGYSRMIAGAGYDFGGHNLILLDYDLVNYQESGQKDDRRLQLTWQVDF